MKFGTSSSSTEKQTTSHKDKDPALNQLLLDALKRSDVLAITSFLTPANVAKIDPEVLNEACLWIIRKPFSSLLDVLFKPEIITKVCPAILYEWRH